MSLLPADYVLGGLVCVLAVMGLFRGFSGTLAFVFALTAATFVGSVFWPFSETLTHVHWQRGLATLLAALLSFGLVRVVVRKFVNGLLSQPADAIFGLVIGVASGAFLIVIWVKIVAWTGIGAGHSEIVRRVSPYVNAAGFEPVGMMTTWGGDR